MRGNFCFMNRNCLFFFFFSAKFIDNKDGILYFNNYTLTKIVKMSIKKIHICGNKEKKMDELFEKLKNLISEKLEVDEAKVTMDAAFRTDFEADSLDTYELVYSIEEELGVNIPDDVANEFVTVGDAYNYIKKCL